MDNHHTVSSVLSRNLRQAPPIVTRASGLFYYTSSGRKIIDACGGSAVACLGHNNPQVIAAVREQMASVSYCHSQFFTTIASENLAKRLVATTNGVMAKALILSSGSESLEAALKLARQYYLELPNPERERRFFIARNPSYHGATLATLGIGGHKSRRQFFEPLLVNDHGKVSQCNVYRGKLFGESVDDYVARVRRELEAEFSRFPKGSVCAFVAETVTGASTGTVPAAEGYFKAVKEVCEKHGALLILDEVMCGMGRTGSMHAWQQEGVEPNIQVIGKAFGAGYVPVSGVLVDHRVNNVLQNGSGILSHGQSFQAHPVACAAGLAVIKTITEQNLLENVRNMGNRLDSLIRSTIGMHPNVGDVRGRGLFRSIEFVKDKLTKEPFPPEKNVGYSLHEMSLCEPFNISIYPGKGSIDGINGDHILIAPPYNVSSSEIDMIVERLRAAIFHYFDHELNSTSNHEFRQW